MNERCVIIMYYFLSDMKEIELKLALSREIVETTILIREKRDKVDG